jgi:23S rRNA pseudouridine2605 synthase
VPRDGPRQGGPQPERLQKVLAEAGVGSRRASEALIAAGRVTIDGRPAVLGERVDPMTQRIAVDGQAIETTAHPTHTYLALHKPAGVTSTVRDRYATRAVVDLVPQALRPPSGRLFPVGRLDQDSEGLLLLTDDGGWAERILHPRFEVEREYAVGLRKPLTVEQARVLESGVPLEEGLAIAHHLRAATSIETRRLLATVEPRPPALAWYRATLRQGWKRQLRRMFGTVDAPVERLVRVRIGSLWLGDLPSGSVRRLKASEAGSLAPSVSGADPTGILRR